MPRAELISVLIKRHSSTSFNLLSLGPFNQIAESQGTPQRARGPGPRQSLCLLPSLFLSKMPSLGSLYEEPQLVTQGLLDGQQCPGDVSASLGVEGVIHSCIHSLNHVSSHMS